MLNGECKDRVFITLMNYLASADFYERAEEIKSDGTIWTWCKWAIATIKSRKQIGVTSHELKMIKKEKIGINVMDCYIKSFEGMIQKKNNNTKFVIGRRKNGGKRRKR
jgi:hypothetical protein